MTLPVPPVATVAPTADLPVGVAVPVVGEVPVTLLVRGVFAAIGLGALALGGLFVYNGVSLRRRGEEIAAAPFADAADVRPGPAAVEGVADPGGRDTVEAPVSGREALVVHLEVHVYEDGWTNYTEGWQTAFEDADGVSFPVEDATGEVLVDPPPEGEYDLETDKVFVGSDETPPDPVRRFVERRAGDDAGDLLAPGESRRYVESVVEPGQDVFVFGEVGDAGAGWDRQYVLDGGADPGRFLLSGDARADVLKGKNQGGIVMYAVGGFFVVFGFLFALGGLVGNV